MAERKTNLVKIKLPRLTGKDAPQEEFVSVNFKNYLIKRGVVVEVPEEVAHVIELSEKAKDEQFEFVDNNGVREA